MKKQNENNKKNNRAAYSGVGNIESPPAGDAEKTYIEKIDINKINNFTQTDTIDDITNGTAGNY